MARSFTWDRSVLKAHWHACRASLLAGLCVTALSAALVQPVSAQSSQPSASGTMVKGLPDFTELVEQAGPSVVNIRTLEKAAVRDPQSSEPDAEMQEFFRRFLACPCPRPMPPTHPDSSAPTEGNLMSNPEAWARGSSCPPMAL